MEKNEEYHKLISTEPISIKGEYGTKNVWLNGKQLTPEHSQQIYKHSSNGFDWGHSGDGPSQLALAILLEVTKNKKVSLILHHLFKNDYMLYLPKSDFEISINIGNWLKNTLLAAWNFIEFTP